jgi:methylthioribose-1-phosphate isomerase
MIDQTLLPTQLSWIELTDVEAIHEAIYMLRVRGAPAIGIAAAMGLVASVQHEPHANRAALEASLIQHGHYLKSSRPTAVNLAWAVDRMIKVFKSSPDLNVKDSLERLGQEAMAIRDEDEAMCRAIGRHGATLLQDGFSILTHCNAGSLAASRYGTALAPVYTAAEGGIRGHVFVDETRPLLQGSRLTAWELSQADIENTLICDNMAAQVMREGKVNAVFVGADRIAANGDAANKIGTYGVACLARMHNIPFYVLAPVSTFDLSLPSGDLIPIEERPAYEIKEGFGKKTAPDKTNVYAPAFDVTPAELITGIITDRGILRPDFTGSIKSLLQNNFD